MPREDVTQLLRPRRHAGALPELGELCGFLADWSGLELPLAEYLYDSVMMDSTCTELRGHVARVAAGPVAAALGCAVEAAYRPGTETKTPFIVHSGERRPH